MTSVATERVRVGTVYSGEAATFAVDALVGCGWEASHQCEGGNVWSLWVVVSDDDDNTQQAEASGVVSGALWMMKRPTECECELASLVNDWESLEDATETMRQLEAQ